MNQLEELKQVIEEEQELLPSDGAKIGYAIDHFGLTIDEISDCAKKVGLSEISIVELLTSTERSGKNVSEAVQFLKDYTAETVKLTQEERKKEYLQTSSLGYLQTFNDAITASQNRKVVSTGFKSLDKVLDGGLYDGLYIVGAIPSLGKTTMIMQIADYIAMQGTDVLIFSLEMSHFELMARSISRLTARRYRNTTNDPKVQKTARGIMDGSRYQFYSDDELRQIAYAKNAYSKYAEHIYIIEGMGDVGVKHIRERAEKHVEITGNTPIIVVDYVQILSPYNVKASDKQNIDRAMVELKRLSRDLCTSVIGISSFNRSNYNSKAAFSAFKESGSLEYGSDVVIGLQLEGAGDADFDSTEAKNRSPREVEALILKNRNGKTGDTILFDYYPQVNLFRDRGIKGDRYV